jgi:hypothetical protein
MCNTYNLWIPVIRRASAPRKDNMFPLRTQGGTYE